LQIKRLGREADNSPLSSAEVKNVWSYTSIPYYAFTEWYPFKAQGQLYFYLSPYKQVTKAYWDVEVELQIFITFDYRKFTLKA
jgi:hypothetical protein